MKNRFEDSYRMPMLWNFSQDGELFKEKECLLAAGLQYFLLRSVSRLVACAAPFPGVFPVT